MANNYLRFSESLGPLNRKKEAWLKKQLEPIVVVKGTEYAEGEAPDCDEHDYRGLRCLRDYEDADDDSDTRGFEIEYQGTGKERRAWLYAEEGDDPGRAAHVVPKFLKMFALDQCWLLTYATTCSKPRG